jgi:hypothetical protein
VVLCGVTVVVTARLPLPAAWTAGVMQAGVLAALAVPSALVISEAWAGVLIGLSVCAFALGGSALAVPLGLLALFVRELAAPYCVVCTIAAAAKRRWLEVGAWLSGAGLYAGYYAWHVSQVRAHGLPTDLAHASSWLEFGGLGYLLGTVHWNAWLIVTPPPVTALALVLIVAGTANPRAPLHVRATGAAYVAFFLVAGKAFDTYWGLVAMPTWALACGYGVETTGEAIRTAFGPSRLVQN